MGPDTCSYCALNMVGGHERPCPLHPFAIVWTPEGAESACAVDSYVIWEPSPFEWKGTREQRQNELGPVV